MGVLPLQFQKGQNRSSLGLTGLGTFAIQIDDGLKPNQDVKVRVTSREGDPLTDNSHIDDGYRYHDVFHIGCAILLGWSPVMRRILRCKRKSVPNVDVVEDGARALVTEEGVSAVVFGHARNYSMFEKSESVDYELLRTIRAMVAPFEVRTRSLSDWEHTILASFRVWRKLIENGGGTVIADSAGSTFEYEAPTW